MAKILFKVSELKRKLFFYFKYYFKNSNDNTWPLQDLAKELTAFAIIISFGIIFINIMKSLNSDYIVIEPFEVPVQLTNDGYTSKAIANKLIVELENLSRNSVIKKESVLINTSSVAVPDIILLGQSNSLRSLTIAIKETISKPLFIVTGGIVNNNGKLTLLVRLNGKNKIDLLNPNENISDKNNNIDNMINAAALRLYLQIDPLLVAGYYYKNEDYTYATKVLKAMSIDAKHAGVTYLIWANSLYYLKEYDEAIRKIELIDKADIDDNIRQNVYNTWGDVLRKKNIYDEAITKYEKAITINALDSYPYYMVGDLLVLQSKYKESIKYLSKAIELDKDKKDSKDSIQVISNIIKSFTELDANALDPMKDRWNQLIMLNRGGV